MKLQNDYKVILEKAPTIAEGGKIIRNFAASKELGGAEAVEVQINNKPDGVKLVYSDGKNLFASTTGIPSKSDAIITLTANGEIVFGAGQAVEETVIEKPVEEVLPEEGSEENLEEEENPAVE